jgi:hypothetical protein
MHPEEENNSSDRESHAEEPFDMSKPPPIGSAERPAWNIWHTEQLIEQEAQRYVREGFYTDIEQARRESREAMWPFA